MSELPDGYVMDTDYEEEDDADDTETETIEVSKLAPTEIADYVNSLKNMAKYWYDTFFPAQSENLTKEEQIWVDKLNRIGIGHFRPLVTVIISRRDFNSEERIAAFKAIERFIFICFRLGNFNASFCSSEYYRASRSLYLNEMTLEEQKLKSISPTAEVFIIGILFVISYMNMRRVLHRKIILTV